MTTGPQLRSGEISSSEVLLWQGKFRRTFVVLVGFGTIALKWADVLSADSVVARHIGARSALLIGLAMIVAYLIFNQVVLGIVRRRAHAGLAEIAATIAADMALLFGLIFVITPPLEYARGLIISIFTVMLTQLYFGQRATLWHVFCVALFYTVVVLAAAAQGRLSAPGESLWNLALYMLGVLIFVGLQGQIAQRLGRIVQVFERAQGGDFSLQYDDSLDRMPDAITVVGRAYNRMRGDLEMIVLTDPLSGCFNRRGFDQLTTREVSRAVRGAHPIAVLAIDVDHFKRINDEFGHLTGDEVLREMGALLRETARLGDVVARIGGEEFEILAPDTGADGAQILAERVQHAFRTKRFASVGGQRKISISIGIAAEVARNDQVAGALIARADEALYVAKRNGRDRSELWHPGMRAFDGSLPGRRTLEQRAVVEE